MLVRMLLQKVGSCWEKQFATNMENALDIFNSLSATFPDHEKRVRRFRLQGVRGDSDERCNPGTFQRAFILIHLVARRRD